MSRLIKIGLNYRSSIKRLRGCCSEVDRLLAQNRIKCSHCELIYESAFVSAIARFEGLLNELLKEFVCGPSSTQTGCYSLIRPRSRNVFRPILTGGRQYVDLMPFRDCVKVAKRFLNEGKPFSDIDESDRNILAQAVLVRNAIAHRNDAAMKTFRTEVNGVNLLTSSRQFPGSYLRRVYRSHPTQTWNDLYFDTFEKVGVLLTLLW